jgi:hypothetical protein
MRPQLIKIIASDFSPLEGEGIASNFPHLQGDGKGGECEGFPSQFSFPFVTAGSLLELPFFTMDQGLALPLRWNC